MLNALPMSTPGQAVGALLLLCCVALTRSVFQYLTRRHSTAAVTDRLRQSLKGVESAQRATVIRALAQLENTQRRPGSR